MKVIFKDTIVGAGLQIKSSMKLKDELMHTVRIPVLTNFNAIKKHDELVVYFDEKPVDKQKRDLLPIDNVFKRKALKVA